MLHLSSSSAKILAEKLFRTWEIPRSGSKAKNGEKKRRKKKRERLNDGDNNGQATHGARKPPGPIPWISHYDLNLPIGLKPSLVPAVPRYQSFCDPGSIKRNVGRSSYPPSPHLKSSKFLGGVCLELQLLFFLVWKSTKAIIFNTSMFIFIVWLLFPDEGYCTKILKY